MANAKLVTVDSFAQRGFTNHQRPSGIQSHHIRCDWTQSIQSINKQISKQIRVFKRADSKSRVVTPGFPFTDRELHRMSNCSVQISVSYIKYVLRRSSSVREERMMTSPVKLFRAVAASRGGTWAAFAAAIAVITLSTFFGTALFTVRVATLIVHKNFS
jgi:hypothetical protein